MRRSAAAATVALAAATPLLLAGCGKPAPPAARVQLTLSGPQDTAVVNDDSVRVTGRVRPASASVYVLGRAATVTNGTFTATVALDRGANVIDVLAGAPTRRAAVAALRITRQDLVEIPDLAGRASADEARDELAGLGLKPEISDSDGFFTGLLPVGVTVCETTPAAGTQVESGTTVQVVVSRIC